MKSAPPPPPTESKSKTKESIAKAIFIQGLLGIVIGAPSSFISAICAMILFRSSWPGSPNIQETCTAIGFHLVIMILCILIIIFREEENVTRRRGVRALSFGIVTFPMIGVLYLVMWGGAQLLFLYVGIFDGILIITAGVVALIVQKKTKRSSSRDETDLSLG